jgi:hypothetical protein
MDDERPEKRAVRELWVEEAVQSEIRFPEDEEPLYLTLCGAHGRDISELIDRGLVTLTETNSISNEDKFKIIAVESSPLAVLELQRRYPGLKILETNFQNIIRGPDPFTWPNREEESYCRARVINLDLNSSLAARVREGEVFFPILAWIAKLGRLHATPPRRDWSLCLTLHGQIEWSTEVCIFVQRFLAENFTREERFAAACKHVLGQDLCGRISQDPVLDFSGLSREAQQQLLMTFVPKLITQLVLNQGWLVDTERNLRYGAPGHAPMVTWVVRFQWSAAALETPDQSYRVALAGILRSAGSIGVDGSIQQII